MMNAFRINLTFYLGHSIRSDKFADVFEYKSVIHEMHENRHFKLSSVERAHTLWYIYIFFSFECIDIVFNIISLKEKRWALTYLLLRCYLILWYLISACCKWQKKPHDTCLKFIHSIDCLWYLCLMMVWSRYILAVNVTEFTRAVG